MRGPRSRNPRTDLLSRLLVRTSRPLRPREASNRPETAPIRRPPKPKPRLPEPQAKRADQVGRGAAAGSNWLRAQPADAYVLQLIGSASRDTVSGFLGRHAFGAKAAWVTTQRNGQDWHIVVYGPFPDRGSAHTAIGSLPPEVRALRPWARRISDITRALAAKP